MKTKSNYFKNIACTCLLVLGILIYTKHRECLINYLNSIIEYIALEPVGIKQNKALSKLLSDVYKIMLDPDRCVDLVTSIKVANKIVTSLYNLVLKHLRELFDLLRNRTYNPLMKRYDNIYLKIDQIVVAMILFAVLMVIFMNLVAFYCFSACSDYILDKTVKLIDQMVDTIFT